MRVMPALATGVVAGGLLIGAFASPAMAAEHGPVGSKPAAVTSVAPKPADAADDKGSHKQHAVADAIQALGLTGDQVAAIRGAYDTNLAQVEQGRVAARVAALKPFVSKGVITQAQADAISADKSMGVEKFVKAKAVSKSQMKALKAALRGIDHADEQSAATATAKDLVAKGVITQAQADALVAAFDEQAGITPAS